MAESSASSSSTTSVSASASASTSGGSGGGGEGNGETIAGPLVFSCQKCKTIIGDSFSFLSSNEEMRTITLTASSNIQRSADVYTSKCGGDVGSTYFSFTCFNCQAPLGRYYLTTSKDLDSLREKFTFSVDGISSYELGKAQHGKMPEPVALEADAAEAPTADAGSLGASLATLNEEVFKIQHVFVGMLQRLEAVEMRVGIAPGMMGGGYYPPGQGHGQGQHRQQQQQQQGHRERPRTGAPSGPGGGGGSGEAGKRKR